MKLNFLSGLKGRSNKNFFGIFWNILILRRSCIDDIIKKYNKDKQRERKKAGIKEAKSDMERASRKIGEKFISRNDLPNPALDDDENADVIEVPVWNNTGKTLEPSSFYTKSETPDLPDM